MAFTSNDDELLCSRVDDAIELSYVRNKPYFIPFMSERKQMIVNNHLKFLKFSDFLWFGGFNQAERKMLCILSAHNTEVNFPIKAIKFSYNKSFKISHRDILGSLMAQGIQRDTVGDILIFNGYSIAFVKDDLYDYIKAQLFKIGKVGVKITEANLENIVFQQNIETKIITVNSLRLDTIIANICNLSREKTKEFIFSGNVCVNYLPTKNISLNIKENDVFTVKGYGKFVFKSVIGQTKKGRIKVEVDYFR